jgi:pyruvate/2-oxoglutarate/acetoin dehydrogenase E1 component
MNYKDAITKCMNDLAKDEKAIFLGYNIKFGSLGYGTLAEVPEKQRVETPVAENLMVGLATGLAIEGFKPLVFFERHDFMLNCLDSLINHLDKIQRLSEGEYNPKVIIRATVGSTAPLDPGLQHTQDFSTIFKDHLKLKVFEPKTPQEVLDAYASANRVDGPVLIIEKKDLYGVED